MMQFDYEKPELVDLSSFGAKGDGGSCYIDCSSDNICPGSTDLI